MRSSHLKNNDNKLTNKTYYNQAVAIDVDGLELTKNIEKAVRMQNIPQCS